MDDLVGFLEARIAEDETAAKAATPGPWREDGMSIRGQPDGTPAARSIRDTLVVKHTWPQEAAHVVRHDPVRALRETAAKRKLLALAAEADDIHYDRLNEVGADVPEVLIGERIRRCLAAIYGEPAATGTG